MQSITLRSRVSADGILRLELPVELANQELDLVLVYQTVGEEREENCSEESPLITLNQEDSIAFAESLLNPPQPSLKMRMAACEYKQSMGF